MKGEVLGVEKKVGLAEEKKDLPKEEKLRKFINYH